MTEPTAAKAGTVTIVTQTRIAPDQTEAFAGRTASAKSLLHGRASSNRRSCLRRRLIRLQGYRFEPPIPGVQDDWLTILRFDSEANLQTWLNLPERKKLVDEAAAFTEEYHTRIVRTGFDQWFKVGDRDTVSPPAWKQNMVVLMTLYPVVMLITAWIEHPFLVGTLKMSHWAALFIDNTIGVLVLSVLTPWASRRLDWWLRPADSERKRDIAGAALVVWRLCPLPAGVLAIRNAHLASVVMSAFRFTELPLTPDRFFSRLASRT
ncbi:MAG TPA: hypothetical protein VHK26_11380 [Methyloceanibacter sp.]|jgi:antibiotic biosynthesis monooxygenase (ABM) superfamily enzyme|nr:hypothetical protein [Methyloceanibacter sp.]